MSENEETKWRLGMEPGQEDIATSEEQEKEELQNIVQAKAEDISGGGESSLITKPEEVTIADTQYQPPRKEKKAKKSPRSKVVKKNEYNNIILTSISKKLEKQANQLAKIEKLIQPLQKSFNKIDKQSNTIKQVYTILTQLQRQLHHQFQRQNTQKKKGKARITSSKK